MVWYLNDLPNRNVRTLKIKIYNIIHNCATPTGRLKRSRTARGRTGPGGLEIAGRGIKYNKLSKRIYYNVCARHNTSHVGKYARICEQQEAIVTRPWRPPQEVQFRYVEHTMPTLIAYIYIYIIYIPNFSTRTTI